MRVIIAVLAFHAAVSITAPFERHVLHERRTELPAGWLRSRRLGRHDTVPIRIALSQPNISCLEQYLHDVSHPESTSFGKHWTPREIADAFRPSVETVTSVKEWLLAADISADRITVARSHGWIHFNATAQEAESLLKAEFHGYRHVSGTRHIGCDAYHIPEHSSPHVDFVLPTVHFDTHIDQMQKTRNQIQKRNPPISEPKQGPSLPASKPLTELEDCDKHIVPDCLRLLYEIPPVLTDIQSAPYGIVEYSPQAFRQQDLNAFFANYSAGQKQREPDLVSIDGGEAQQNLGGFENNGESNLDLEFAMALADPIPVSVYQVGDPYLSGSFNTFLDAIDGPYCQYDGGDDPNQDADYPDTANPDGYQGDNQCGGAPLTKVISTSYGFNEADLTPAYEQRQCNEWAKLGLMGTTVLFSSGDHGVAGNGGSCLSSSGNITNNSSGVFNPAFPSTCPYVTSVGATQIKSGASVTDPEVACETVIQSGGGFSNVFPMPSYQQPAVNPYYEQYDPKYGSETYNNTRLVRGYPDIAVNGANYVVSIDGNFTLAYGTSASSPTLGAIITIINEYRALLGKGSVGFFNPTLYAHPEILHDITAGANPGCGTPGFTAVPGWDPLTGMGTPNAAAMLDFFLSV